MDSIDIHGSHGYPEANMEAGFVTLIALTGTDVCVNLCVGIINSQIRPTLSNPLIVEKYRPDPRV